MPIINQIVAGGGTTPTGTLNITTNGTHDVTNYASADVAVPTTAPTSYLEYEVVNGELLHSKSTASIININGATSIGANILTGAYSGNTNITGIVDWSSLTGFAYAKTESCCKNCFSGCTGITGVDMRNFTGSLDYASQNGTSQLMTCFSNCTGLLTANCNFSSWVNIKTANMCSNMFSGCTGLTNLKALFPNLTTVWGPYSCRGMFIGCTGFVDEELPSLQAIDDNRAFDSTFFNCTNLISFRFPSLSDISDQTVLVECFDQCTSLQSLWFYALNTNSFGGYSDQFQNMLSRCSNVTVHFPMAVQSKIGSWAHVTSGFGGTNTTVLFDLVSTLTGADSNTYTRKEKESTSTATAWLYNNTLYYTSGVSNNTAGVNEPAVNDTIYSDAACTTAVTTISSIA